MKNSRLALLAGLLCSPLLAANQAVAPTPTSDIPARREFPVNENVSPCENFYEYACSTAVSRFKLRDDRSNHTFAFSDSRERLLDRKKTFLKDLQTKLNGKAALPERSKTLATVYDACMNPEARKKEELSEVATTLTELKSLKSRDAFLKFLAAQRDASETSFVDVGSAANQDKPETLDFYFDVGLQSLPERSYYLKPEVTDDYVKVLEKFFVTIGESKPSDSAKAVLNLETAFAKVHPLPSEMRAIWSQRSSITKKDILKKYPSFHLDAALAKVPDRANIRHFIPETYDFTEKTLEKANLDDLKALYLYHRLSSLMDDAYPEFFQTKYAFNQKHLGASPVRPVREERCTQMVMGTFTKELDAELLPVMFPDFPQEKFVNLAEKVRASIIDGVKTNTWLSEEGRKGAIEKMSKAKLQLVKPLNDEEWYFNPPATYTRGTPIANARALDKAETARMYAELLKPRNRDRWGMGPLTVNAYYSSTDNKFVMPIGILQYPFYDPSLPIEVNLGAVGAVIGHELGHGIDDQGAKYDSEGKLRQWMSDKDIETFRGRGKKFVDQFNKIGHNGELTLGENIGDLTGVTFAYHAAFPAGKGTIEQKKAFFLQYGRLWCGVELPKYAEQMLKTDPHSRGYARVNQQLKNQPAFAEAFACKAGDAMVLKPDEIVKIW
ncbi:MAG: M13 family metallopeptidase [Chitinophagaceae bacterium]|nr:M13 family metallopeptidase [Oligoflexus sp.]